MPSSKIVVLPGHEPVKKARKPKRFIYVLMDDAGPHRATLFAAYDSRLAAARAADRFNLSRDEYEIMRVSVDPRRLAR